MRAAEVNLIDVWKSFWLGEDYAIAEAATGKSDVTISSRVAQARLAGKWWGVWGCKALNVLFMAEDHCGGAIQHDLERANDAEAELEAAIAQEKAAQANLQKAEDKVASEPPPQP
jgi:hypothetical protein